MRKRTLHSLGVAGCVAVLAATLLAIPISAPAATPVAIPIAPNAATVAAVPIVPVAPTAAGARTTAPATTPPIPVQGTGSGYAWANRPGASSYSPDETYSYNSAAQGITITRRGAGVYQVVFAGLGGGGTAGGSVQVTSYGGSAVTCNVANWASGGADFTVNVRCFDVRGRPVDSRYTVSVEWPVRGLRAVDDVPARQRFETMEAARARQEGRQQEAEELPGPGDPAGPDSEVTINEDGVVEIHHPDGRIEQRTVGQITIIHPDGRTEVRAFHQVRPPIPPALPDDAEAAWLDAHAQGLLDIIQVMVGDEAAARYLEHEGGDLAVYEKIEARARTLDFLLRP